MRLFMLVSLALTVLLSVVFPPLVEAQGTRTGVSSPIVSDAQGQPDGKLDIDIKVNREGGAGRWYENPMWLAIVGLAVIVVLGLFVMAARGGGTTVVKG